MTNGNLIGDEDARIPNGSGYAPGRKMDRGEFDVEGVVSVGYMVDKRWAAVLAV